MANYSERRRRRRFGGKIAIVAGILVALIGVYFMVGISRNTDKINAECTEETVGTITASDPSGKESVGADPGRSRAGETGGAPGRYPEKSL